MSTLNAARERIIRVEAIVLRRLDLGETDRVLTVLSDKFGKMKIIAKGIRRPSSRLGSHLELFSRSNLILARGRELDVVTSADVIDFHPELRTNLDALATASHAAELVDRFLADRDESLATYRGLVKALASLGAGASPAKVARWFEMALLGEMGVRPELFHCVVCHNEVISEPNRFSIRFGGVLCHEHSDQDTGGPMLSLGAQKVLRMLIRQDLDAFLTLTISPTIAAEMETALGAFIKHQLERDLQSLRIMRRVEESIPIWADYKSTK